MSSRAQSSATSSSSSSSSSRESRRPNRSLLNQVFYDARWITQYREICPEQSLAVRIMAYATGARDATVIKKLTPRIYGEPPGKSDELAEHESRLYWITLDEARRRGGGSRERSQGRSLRRSPTYRNPQDGQYIPAPAGGQFGTNAFVAATHGATPVGTQHRGMNGHARPPGPPGGIPAPGTYPGGIVPPQQPQGGV